MAGVHVGTTPTWRDVGSAARTSCSGAPSSRFIDFRVTSSGNRFSSATHGASCVANTPARVCKGHVKKSFLSGIKHPLECGNRGGRGSDWDTKNTSNFVCQHHICANCKDLAQAASHKRRQKDAHQPLIETDAPALLFVGACDAVAGLRGHERIPEGPQHFLDDLGADSVLTVIENQVTEARAGGMYAPPDQVDVELPSYYSKLRFPQHEAYVWKSEYWL
ncbi:hypothetical protein PPTG_22381 [Phytophthora nicotianae INRA-310]|uniref:Uncharacterized protein n=1 Tax=Phytophthora nicotianae (strain INRA-310) TaxID=761204 RepID=W2QHF2_PHYN3|nr:hypothetical protein PPTG_22381 [Phytophthora nicotianae INRA-310]ETN12618.1 hypothetical protein PPTG_22381 [Phytophthora nicotianae INRA-310]